MKKSRTRRKRTKIEAFCRYVTPQGPDDCWEWQGPKESKNYGILYADGQHYVAHRVAYELLVGPIPERLHVLHRCDNPPCCNPAHLSVGTTADNCQDALKKFRRGRLSPAQIEAIRHLVWTEGKQYKQVSEELGIPRTTVTYVATGKTWKGVGGGEVRPEGKGRTHTHCKRGHALTEENIRIRYDPRRGSYSRRCRECDLVRVRAGGKRLRDRRRKLPPPATLLEYLDRYTPHKPEGACWEWHGPINPNGYGHACHKYARGLAHRFVYELTYNTIPPAHVVRHTCHNRLCVNPKHLRAGTQRENVHDALKAGRRGRVSPTEVRRIRALRTSGVSLRAIAKQLQLPYTTVQYIASGKTWKVLP